jgi:mannosyltransferase OCH1-like enzyme
MVIMIPKKLHFTYKTDDLPRIYKENLKRWQAYCPDWEMILHTDRKVLKFFERHFSQYSNDIKKIRQGVVLADLFRYGVLYIFGGMYNDIDTIPLNPIPDEWLTLESVIGYEYQPSKFECSPVPSYSTDTLCQWSFLAKPKHPLFKEALDKGMENLKEKNFELKHERDVLTATGPLLFTEIATKYLDTPEVLFLDMDVFAPIYLKTPNLSNCIVFHQFHGRSGWKLEFQCPQIKLL